MAQCHGFQDRRICMLMYADVWKSMIYGSKDTSACITVHLSLPKAYQELSWRRGWDSNPRKFLPSLVFKTSAFDHSATPPVYSNKSISRSTRKSKAQENRFNAWSNLLSVYLKKVVGAAIPDATSTHILSAVLSIFLICCLPALLPSSTRLWIDRSFS